MIFFNSFNRLSDYVSKVPDKTRFMACYVTNLEYI